MDGKFGQYRWSCLQWSLAVVLVASVTTLLACANTIASDEPPVADAKAAPVADAGKATASTPAPAAEAPVEEKTPDQEKAVAIYAAAQKACESLRSGHFEMTAVGTVPNLLPGKDPTSNPPGKIRMMIQVENWAEQYKCWFDADKQRYRIDLLPDPKNSIAPKGTKWILNGDEVTSVTWSQEQPGKKVPQLNFKTRNTNDPEVGLPTRGSTYLDVGHCVFNPRAFFSISPIPFVGGSIPHGRSQGDGPKRGRAEWPEPKSIFKPSHLKANVELKKLDNGDVVVVNRNQLDGGAVVMEFEFRTANGYLPVRRTMYLEFTGQERRREFETTSEWTEKAGVFVPTRVTTVKSNILADQLADQTAALELNWISVNQPVDEALFTLDKKAIEDEAAE